MRKCWSLKSSRFGTLFFWLVVFSSYAQFSEPREALTRTYFSDELYLFPIEPGNTNSLAGTMGELRSNHFHSGIDIRTGNRVGLPVLSTQSGYVWRVVVSPVGFGNAIYVRHPNGTTSVYGHLDKFNKVLAAYVRSEQYRRKSFDVDLYFKGNQFSVAKGDTIAYSGNSGGSSGPHLHFDIRGKNNEALNPLAFQFPEIRDNTSPIVEKVAFNTLDIDSRINDQFGRQEFYVIKEGDKYSLPQPILAAGRIGIELLAYDRLDDSRARCGINHIEVIADGTTLFKQRIEEVNFGDTRNILALMNYKVQQLTGDRYNKLYVDDGNDLKYYEGTRNKGFLHVRSGEIPVQVIMTDAYGNQSTLEFRLRKSPEGSQPVVIKKPTKALSSEVLFNTLKVTSFDLTDSSAKFFVNGEEIALKPSYEGDKMRVYLVDLRRWMPDSVVVGSEKLAYDFKGMVPSEVEYTYYSDQLDVRFPKGSLFDTTYLQVRHDEEKSIYRIGDPTIPIHRNISVTLKPNEAHSEKVAVYSIYGDNYQYIGGNWANGKITFYTRDFGNYTLLRDTIPPAITKVVVNPTIARFKIKDDLSGIDYFEANLNGEWLLMNHDPKTNTIWSEKLDPKKPLSGDFALKVVDRAGNESTYFQKI